jgi:hypothetical protein
MKMSLFELAGKHHEGLTGLIPDPLRYVLERSSLTGIHPVWLQNLVARTDVARRAGGFDPALRFGDDDDFAFRLGCETHFCFVNMPMVLIDRTPPPERHVGANRRWDDEDFRLTMAQLRYEKRLRMAEQLPDNIRKLIRRDLASVESGWANWHLHREAYQEALEAVTRAARYNLTPSLAVKWLLTLSVPGLAKKAAAARERHRTREAIGIG